MLLIKKGGSDLSFLSYLEYLLVLLFLILLKVLCAVGSFVPRSSTLAGSISKSMVVVCANFGFDVSIGPSITDSSSIILGSQDLVSQDF